MNECSHEYQLIEELYYIVQYLSDGIKYERRKVYRCVKCGNLKVENFTEIKHFKFVINT